MLEAITIFYVLMAAPSATDDHVMNYAVPLAIFKEAEECSDTKMWIDDHSLTLPRHIFCIPVGVPKGEAI